MTNILIKKRKAQVALTLSWFFAFVIIFFIMLFLVAATSTISSARSVPVVSWLLSWGKKEINLNENAPGDAALLRNLEVFVNANVEFEGNILSAKDLFSGKLFVDKENELAVKFKEIGEGFLIKNSEILPGNSYNGMWLRVYNTDEVISKSYSGKNKGFEAVYGGGCEPENDKASVLKLLVSEDKKIVLCSEGK